MLDKQFTNCAIAPDLVDGLAKPSSASDVYSFGRLFKNVICYFPLNVSELNSSVKDMVKLCLRYDHAERPTCESIIKVKGCLARTCEAFNRRDREEPYIRPLYSTAPTFFYRFVGI